MINITGLQAAKGEGFKPVPAGTYVVNISKTEVKPCKDGQKQMLKVNFRINDGSEFNGKPIFDQIVLPHHSMSETANEMSANKVKRLCLATGVEVTGDDLDPNTFTGRTLRIEVTVRQYEGKDQNEVRDYLPME